MKITSEDQQVPSKVQGTKNSVAKADCPAENIRLSGGTLDCPVPHTGLSSTLGNSSSMTSSRWHWWRESTGMFSVTSRLFGVKACSADGHLRCQIQRLGAPNRGTGLSDDPTGLFDVPQRAAAFLQRLVLCWGL
jgi:hypothetical protein